VSSAGRARLARASPFVLIAAVAFALRTLWLDVPVYGDEGWFYSCARYFAATLGNVRALEGNAPVSLAPIFWYRPIHALALAPGAAFSFAGYRLINAALSSLLAPLAVAFALGRGVRPAMAWATGLVVATLPFLVVWGTLAFADAPATLFLLAGLVLADRGRRGAALASWLLACWTKESFVVIVAAIFAIEFVTDLRAKRPLRTRMRTLHAAVVALGPVPFLAARYLLRAPPPGGSGFVPLGDLLDRFFVSAWLVPLVVIGLWRPRTRNLSALALVVPFFYAFWDFGLGRIVQAWYATPGLVLTLVAIAANLDELGRRLRTAAQRVLGALAVALIALILVATILLPPGSARSALLHPAGGGDPGGLTEAYRYEHAREAEFRAAFEALPAPGNGTVVTVDVYLGLVMYPVNQDHREIRWAWTGEARDYGPSLPGWVSAIENSTTFIGPYPSPLNAALWNTYADCASYGNARFLVIPAHACDGRGPDLASAYGRARPANA